MGAVLAAAIGDFAEKLHFVESVSAFAVAQAIETALAPLVDHHVQAVERVKQAVRAGKLHRQRFDLDGCPLTGRRKREAIQRAILVGGD